MKKIKKKRYSVLNRVAYEFKPFLLGIAALGVLNASTIGDSSIGRGSAFLLLLAATASLGLRYNYRTAKK